MNLHTLRATALAALLLPLSAFAGPPVEVEILDHLFQVLPSPPFTDEEKQAVAKKVYEHVWQQSAGGHFRSGEAAA